MKITATTPLWVLSQDGCSKHTLAGIMQMAIGGTKPEQITIFTEQPEAQVALEEQTRRHVIAKRVAGRPSDYLDRVIEALDCLDGEPADENITLIPVPRDKRHRGVE